MSGKRRKLKTQSSTNHVLRKGYQVLRELATERRELIDELKLSRTTQKCLPTEPAYQSCTRNHWELLLQEMRSYTTERFHVREQIKYNQLRVRKAVEKVTSRIASLQSRNRLKVSFQERLSRETETLALPYYLLNYLGRKRNRNQISSVLPVSVLKKYTSYKTKILNQYRDIYPDLEEETQSAQRPFSAVDNGGKHSSDDLYREVSSSAEDDIEDNQKKSITFLPESVLLKSDMLININEYDFEGKPVPRARDSGLDVESNNIPLHEEIKRYINIENRIYEFWSRQNYVSYRHSLFCFILLSIREQSPVCIQMETAVDMISGLLFSLLLLSSHFSLFVVEDKHVEKLKAALKLFKDELHIFGIFKAHVEVPLSFSKPFVFLIRETDFLNKSCFEKIRRYSFTSCCYFCNSFNGGNQLKQNLAQIKCDLPIFYIYEVFSEEAYFHKVWIQLKQIPEISTIKNFIYSLDAKNEDIEPQTSIGYNPVEKTNTKALLHSKYWKEVKTLTRSPICGEGFRVIIDRHIFPESGTILKSFNRVYCKLNSDAKEKFTSVRLNLKALPRKYGKLVTLVKVPVVNIESSVLSANARHLSNLYYKPPRKSRVETKGSWRVHYSCFRATKIASLALAYPAEKLTWERTENIHSYSSLRMKALAKELVTSILSSQADFNKLDSFPFSMQSLAHQFNSKIFMMSLSHPFELDLVMPTLPLVSSENEYYRLFFDRSDVLDNIKSPIFSLFTPPAMASQSFHASGVERNLFQLNYPQKVCKVHSPKDIWESYKLRVWCEDVNNSQDAPLTIVVFLDLGDLKSFEGVEYSFIETMDDLEFFLKREALLIGCIKLSVLNSLISFYLSMNVYTFKVLLWLNLSRIVYMFSSHIASVVHGNLFALLTKSGKLQHGESQVEVLYFADRVMESPKSLVQALNQLRSGLQGIEDKSWNQFLSYARHTISSVYNPVRFNLESEPSFRKESRKVSQSKLLGALTLENHLTRVRMVNSSSKLRYSERSPRNSVEFSKNILKSPLEYECRRYIQVIGADCKEVQHKISDGLPDWNMFAFTSSKPKNYARISRSESILSTIKVEPKSFKLEKQGIQLGLQQEKRKARSTMSVTKKLKQTAASPKTLENKINLKLDVFSKNFKKHRPAELGGKSSLVLDKSQSKLYTRTKTVDEVSPAVLLKKIVQNQLKLKDRRYKLQVKARQQGQ